MVDIPASTREDLANCEDIDELVDTDEAVVYNDLYREDNIKE